MKNLIMVGASAKWVVDRTDFSDTSVREVAIVVGIVMAIYLLIFIASYIKDKN
mgnify:CR=1 FL=1